MEKGYKEKVRRAYLLYANESYYKIVESCAKSIREFSDLPILVYMLTSDLKVDIENTTTVRWEYSSGSNGESLYINSGNNFYINRESNEIYKLLIQRPLVTKHALENFAETVAYVDSDSVATAYIDSIFNYYDFNSNIPYFVKGIYDFLIVNGRGGAGDQDDLSTTLEHPLCELLGIDQYVRKGYRQTGFFVAGQKTLDFLEEWYWTCLHPKVLKDTKHYAPFNEETVANVLLWKYNFTKGLPYLYVNGGLDIVNEVYSKITFTGVSQYIRAWFRIPGRKEDILFFHNEKNIEDRNLMIEKIRENTVKIGKMKVLYITPHLSTGGLPQYLLKKIQTFKDQYDIYLVEYANLSPHFVVQKQILEWTLGDRLYTLGEDKRELLKIIEDIKPDVIHLEEVPEFFMDDSLAIEIYGDSNREYFIVESTHSSQTTPSNVKFLPDKFILPSKWSQQRFERDLPEIPTGVWEYPVENYYKDQKLAQSVLGLNPKQKHVLMVGLFTEGKNQGEIFEIAKQLPEIQFHFVGNQAPNFAEYWEPLMKNKPENCTVWRERDDVSDFYQACDLFYFSSKLELNPLSVKEALSYGLPCLFRRLETYLDTYDNIDLVEYIDDNLENTKIKLIEKLKYV